MFYLTIYFNSKQAVLCVPVAVAPKILCFEEIYTTKLIGSVSMYVCMSSYAFRHALRY